MNTTPAQTKAFTEEKKLTGFETLAKAYDDFQRTMVNVGREVDKIANAAL